MSSVSATSSTKATSTTSANQPSATSGPKHGLEKKAGDILTERYTISVDKDRVTIIDRRTKTRINVGGDMNISTKDGDRIRVENGNTTIDLKDGTRITFVPTADGTGIEKVAIVKDREGIVYNNVHESPTSKGIRRGADRIDARFDDGTTLVAGHQIDDLFQNGVGQLKGDVTIAGATSTPSAPAPETPAAPAPAPAPAPEQPTAPAPAPAPEQPAAPAPAPEQPAAPSTGETNGSRPSTIASEAKKRLKELNEKGIDEAFDWAFDKLGGELTPEDQAAIQLYITQLQAFTELFSNINKARGETQRAIVRNTGG
jgi:hypothetical protein